MPAPHFARALGMALVAALFVLPAHTAIAEDIAVKHAQGETAVPVDPATVLTFDLATIDTLDALGVEVDGLPGTNLPAYLSKYGADSYLKIGSLFDPDYEAVNAAAPDLIIVAARSSAVLPELAKIAPTIDLTNDWKRFIDSVKDNSKTLGAIFGKSAEVDALVAALDDKVTSVRAEAANAGTGLVILTSGAEVTAFGPGSRFGWIYDSLGITPAVSGVEAATHGDAVSFEFILEANPDWLFVIDRDAATGTGASKAILDNELVAGTSAWKSGHVVYLDPVRAYVVNGGLPATTALVTQIGDALGAK